MKELALINSRLDGRYDIVKLLGRGSYAEIYVAQDNFAPADSPHRLVVIKALNVFLQDEPDVDLERTLVENFQNEAVALDRVRHPNIINRLGHGTARDLTGTTFHYLVLEYLPGGDLGAMMKAAPLEFDRALKYLEQVCAGLAHAHQQGVIHRDIKPQNLLLTEDRKTVKIADFGVAKFGDLDSPITRVGTNIYAAPEHSPLNIAQEISHGHKIRLTPAADVYSLAKTFYALLTGESPRRFSNQPIADFPPNVAARDWAKQILPVLTHATQTELNERTLNVYDFWTEISRAFVAEEATKIAHQVNVNATPTVRLKDLTEFVAQAPARPAFDSMGNVQIPATQKLIDSPLSPPRPAAEFDTQQKKSAAALAAELAAKNIFEKLGSATSNGNQTIALVNSKTTATTKQPSSSTAFVVPPRVNKFLKSLALRAAIVLLLLAGFVGVMGATVNYLYKQIYPNAVSRAADSPIGHDAVMTGTANLRNGPSPTRQIIGVVPEDSRLKVLSVSDNWYEVKITKRSHPKADDSEADQGWVNSKYIDVQ